MSASYWTQCPRCKARGEKELNAAYGDVPEEQYQEMKDRHNDYEFYETVRVDRNTRGRMMDTGQLLLKVKFRYECQRCGLSGEMKDEKKIDQDAPKWSDDNPSDFYQLDMEVEFIP